MLAIRSYRGNSNLLPCLPVEEGIFSISAEGHARRVKLLNACCLLITSEFVQPKDMFSTIRSSMASYAGFCDCIWNVLDTFVTPPNPKKL